MKTNLATLLIVSLAVSCTLETRLPEPEREEIRFDIGIPATRVAGEAFEPGDRISLYAVEYVSDTPQELQIGGNRLNNECLTCKEAGVWEAEEKLYWGDAPCDFYAVYPYLQPVSVEAHPIDIVEDQNSGDGYERSDLLFAKAVRATREAGKVPLRFGHLLSRCVVNVVKGEKFEGELPDDIVVHIYNTVTSALLNLSHGSLQVCGTGGKHTITMKKISNSRHEAVVVPQNVERRTPLIEVTMGGIAYLLEYSLSFKPGYEHTINLTVNTSPDQEQIEISIDPETDPGQ